ncbi:cupin [Isoptericola sp. NPDC057653]|jgi:quercetin dioxygenase-like cupin family protein|uniref:cupin n=1 Tax=unclassified Isoptericola TaxID=2623355 RepID=UPI0036A86D59
MADLDALTATHLDKARAAEHGRSAEIVVHDGPLRQTVLALLEGMELGEHNSPPAASVLVLHGRLRVTALEGDEEVRAGQLRVLTHERHAVRALEDSVFLLTTVTSIPKP